MADWFPVKQKQWSKWVVTIDMADDFEYQAYQSRTQVNLALNHQNFCEPTLEEECIPMNTARRLSKCQVRSVLHLISQFTEMNIVAAMVFKVILPNLINVPWDQALDIILKSKNLGGVQPNVILVAPATELPSKPLNLKPNKS